MDRIKILNIEDDPVDAEMVDRVLRSAKLHCDIKVVDTRDEFRINLKEFKPDIILSDHSLADFDSFEALKITREIDPDLPFILITGAATEEFASTIISQGAWDYILKDRPYRLPSAVLNALEKAQLRREKQEIYREHQRSESRFQTLTQHISDGLLLLDSEGRIFYGSPSLRALTGFSEESLLKLPLQQFIAENDHALFAETFHSCVSGYRTSDIELQLQNKSGHYVTVEAKFRNLMDIENVAGVLVDLRDITEHKRLMLNLSKSEAFNKGILASLSLQVAVLNNRGDIIAVNQAWVQFVKENEAVPKRSIVGSNYLEVCSRSALAGDLDAKQVLEGLNSVLLGQSSRFEFEYPCPSLTEQRWFLLSVTRMGFESDKFVLSHLDITRTKLAQLALAKSESNLKSIFESTSEGLILTDISGTVLSSNAKSKEMLEGWATMELLQGNPILELRDGKIHASLDQLDERARKETVSTEVAFKLGESSYWFVLNIGPVLICTELQGFCFSIHDITLRKQAELQTLSMVEALETKNKALAQFAFVLSHNLRAPIVKILGLASIIGEDEAENKFILSKIVEETAALDEVVKDVNMVLAARPGEHLRLEPVNIKKKLDMILHALDGELKSANARVVYNLENASTVYTIKSFLYSILLNLISNAIKYRSAERALLVEVTSYQQDNFVCLSVADNGIGIDLERHEHKLFTLFSRLHNHSIPGKGIGLYLVKSHLESMGGHLELKSSPGVGTEFKIFIPDK